MLFNVHIVSPDDYEAYLDDLAAEGNASENPLIGGKFVTDQAGLDSDDEEGSE
jgi:cytochrome c oxidase subunit 2